MALLHHHSIHLRSLPLRTAPPNRTGNIILQESSIAFAFQMALLQHHSRHLRSLSLRTAPPNRTRNKGPLPKFRTIPPVVALMELKPPPYKFDALEPHMSQQTLEFHWGKHHRAYVDNCNKQIQGTELEGCTLEEIIKKAYNNGDPHPVFNNAAQAWNHEFFWECMKPGGGKKPKGEILELIEKSFGSYDEFEKDFKQAAATQFGSGWAWLVLKDDKLVIEKTPNALNPLVWGHTPLLTIDIWEHAYYLDYQNRRPDYISTFMNELVSWDAVTARLNSANAGSAT